MENADRQPSTWRAAVLVGALSAALGALTLGRKSLWYDEAFDGVRVRASWDSLAHLIRATEMSQAAYLVLLKPWATVTPPSEEWIRLPSVVAAALAAGLLVPLGTRLFDRTTGIVAGVLLATNELLVRWSQQARTYALVTFAVVLASLLLLRALDDPRRRNWLLYALAAAFAVYCHFYAGFVIVAHLASLPFAPRRPPLRRVLEAVIAFGVLISVALVFTATATRAQLTWIPTPSLTSLRAVLEAANGGNLLVAAAALTGLVLLAGAARRRVPAARWRLALVGGWIVLPIALGLVVSIFQPILVGRYTIVITPALALAAAVTIATLWRRRPTAAVAALVAVLAVSALEIGRWNALDLEDWRGAVAYVARERSPDDAVVVAPGWAIEGMRYYDGSTPVAYGPATGRTFVLLWGRGPEDLAESMRNTFGPGPLETVAERQFGERLRVRVVEPAG